MLAKLALFLVPFVAAADYRLLVNKPSCVNMNEFQQTFTKLCPVFPANPSQFTSNGVYFHPGDYSGKNNATEALVYCVFHKSDGSTVQYTTDVLYVLGGSLVN
ncbi:hypothetical protein M231_04302 [Tremella mesenterica]|uniref:Uncharacterized protein n=1 Tax=Tremella mesenterica TaxID=5217 RepID=A0A4Q1BKV6_TREME|nr:hypothetical protein M231_04302 [Tremella mesenterica]